MVEGEPGLCVQEVGTREESLPYVVSSHHRDGDDNNGTQHDRYLKTVTLPRDCSGSNSFLIILSTGRMTCFSKISPSPASSPEKVPRVRVPPVTTLKPREEKGRTAPYPNTCYSTAPRLSSSTLQRKKT